MKNQKTVLIVDDEPTARDILEGFLFREGYHLAFAASGQDALDYVVATPPDVILLDVMMPNMDGFEVCERLKSDKRWRHIPIILVTALGEKEDLARGFEAGADDFLHKPVGEMELRARVRSMLRIKKQYDDLQTALQLREDMAGMIVHDMRSPLTAIQGFSELLLMSNNIPEEHQKDILKINSHARRLNSFLNDMLMVAKMEAGQIILNRSPVDVLELARPLKESYDIIAQPKKIEFVLDLPAEGRRVLLDKNLFNRVLDNLITNALKYSPPESTVILRVQYPESGNNPDAAGPQVRFEVLDQGPGIPAEHRDRIFDKFEIVTLKKKGAAQIGLGLAICKMVVEAHGGSISVRANRPAGSIFTVEI